MLIDELYLQVSEETKIKLFIYNPKNLENIKAIILLNHGLGEHIERYKDFTTKLVENNYIVYGHNHRGHKDSISSYSDYGYINSKDGFQTLVDDNDLIIEKIRKKHPTTPIYLFGHSMGSFIVQRYVQLYGKKISGIILSGSGKQSNFPLFFGILYAKLICFLKGPRYKSKRLHKLIFGKYNNSFKPPRTYMDWLNRNEEEVDKYIRDPYCGGVFTASFYRDFLKGLRNINLNFELIPHDIPILIISGSMDPVGGKGRYVEKLYNVFKNNNIENIDLKVYEDARHELILELNKEEVIKDCLNWLEKNSAIS